MEMALHFISQNPMLFFVIYRQVNEERSWYLGISYTGWKESARYCPRAVAGYVTNF